MAAASGTAGGAALSARFGLESMALAALPFLVTFAAATLAYLIVPNCPVRLRHALLGGLFCAAAFEVAKWGFAQFIGRFASYQQSCIAGMDLFKDLVTEFYAKNLRAVQLLLGHSIGWKAPCVTWASRSIDALEIAEQTEV
mgnify:CR=1 FL=1